MNRTTETHLKHGLNRIKKDVTPFLYTSMIYGICKLKAINRIVIGNRKIKTTSKMESHK